MNANVKLSQRDEETRKQNERQRKKPRCGAFLLADDGTRTHDLLHGKSRNPVQHDPLSALGSHVPCSTVRLDRRIRGQDSGQRTFAVPKTRSLRKCGRGRPRPDPRHLGPPSRPRKATRPPSTHVQVSDAPATRRARRRGGLTAIAGAVEKRFARRDSRAIPATSRPATARVASCAVRGLPAP
jgi:hypothetical protein